MEHLALLLLGGLQPLLRRLGVARRDLATLARGLRALPTPSEEEMVARFMRLAWAEEGVALTAEEEAAVSSTISADIAADIAAGAPILHEE